MAEGGIRHYTEWTPRLIRRSRYAYEEESRETCAIMDLLGYGPFIRQIRKDAYMGWDRRRTKLTNGSVLNITAGSKAEGLTCLLESDLDALYVPYAIMCLENDIDQSKIPDHITLFNMNLHRINAGYCRLLLGRHSQLNMTCIINALCDYGRGNFLLSGTLYVEQFKNMHCEPGSVDDATAGPAVPLSNGYWKLDKVHALRCHCPVILKTWANRTRHWPPQNIVEKVVGMEAFVAPIGYKGSAFNHLEWRICFNTAETELVNNLNDTQVKLYVILKMIVNDILKPQTKEITSYVLKNIVLWLAENNPQTLFHSGSLFHWLHEGLDILRTAISTRKLPYYMIPERNLMSERDLEGEQQREWITSITCMMDEGPMVLLRLGKIRRAIISHPEPLLWYSRMRTELEIVKLLEIHKYLQCFEDNLLANESDTMLKPFVERKNKIVEQVWWRMCQEGSSVNDIHQVDWMMLS